MKKGRLISGIVMIVISACLIGCGVFLMLNQNKIKFVSAIRKATNNIVEDIDLFSNMLVPNEFLNAKADCKITTANTINYADKVVTFGGDIYSKYDTQELYSNLALNFGTNPLNVDLIMKDTKLYVKLKDITEKYFYTEVDVPEKSSMELTDEQIVTLKDYFIDSTFEALAKNEITSTEVTLSLNNISYSLEKLEVDVSEKNIQDSFVIFLKKIENDSELSVIANDLLKEGGSTLEDAIKELEDMSDDMSTELLLKYSIYLDSKNVIFRHEVVIPAVEDSTYGDIRLSLDSYTDKEGRNQFMIDIAGSDMSYLTFEVKGIDDSQAVISGTIFGVPLINGSYTKSDSSINLVLTVTDSMSGEQPIDYKLTYTLDTVNKGEDYKLSIKLNIPGFNFESVNSINLKSNYPNAPINDATPFESMTDEEMNALMTYLMGVLPPEFMVYLQTDSAI